LFPVEFTNVRHQAGITLKGRSLSPLAELFIERVHAIVRPLTQSLGDKSTFDISAIGPKAKSAERVAMSALAPQSGLVMLTVSSSPFDP